jgi:hypothetical protein
MGAFRRQASTGTGSFWHCGPWWLLFSCSVLSDTQRPMYVAYIAGESTLLALLVEEMSKLMAQHRMRQHAI